MPPRKRAAGKGQAPTRKASATSGSTRKSQSKVEKDPVFEEVRAAAAPADDDLEKMLVEYDSMRSAYSEPKDHKERREQLRDKITALLASDGPRIYLDSSGSKSYAWQTTPESVDLDVEELIEQVEQGNVDISLLDKVAPRQLSRTGLKSAIQTGAMPSDLVAMLVTITKQTPRVYTKSAGDGEEDE